MERHRPRADRARTDAGALDFARRDRLGAADSARRRHDLDGRLPRRALVGAAGRGAAVDLSRRARARQRGSARRLARRAHRRCAKPFQSARSGPGRDDRSAGAAGLPAPVRRVATALQCGGHHRQWRGGEQPHRRCGADKCCKFATAAAAIAGYGAAGPHRGAGPAQARLCRHPAAAGHAGERQHRQPGGARCRARGERRYGAGLGRGAQARVFSQSGRYFNPAAARRNRQSATGERGHRLLRRHCPCAHRQAGIRRARADSASRGVLAGGAHPARAPLVGGYS